jgi:hypothetical protein
LKPEHTSRRLQNTKPQYSNRRTNVLYIFTLPLQARLAGPVAELLQAHCQSVDPNLLALAEAWQQAEAALAAQGKSVDALAAGAAAAGSDDDDGEEEQEGAAVGGAAADQLPTPEDLQV